MKSTNPIPASLVIGPVTYRIELHNRLTCEDCIEGDERYGEIDHMADAIRIARHCSADKRWEVLIHEVLHGISTQLPGCCQLSEDQVQAITPYLWMVLRDGFGLTPEPLSKSETEVRDRIIEDWQKQDEERRKAAKRIQDAAHAAYLDTL